MRLTVSDEDLAVAAQNGDDWAFARLVAHQYDRLYVLCFGLTGTQHDAEDLPQDIYAALPSMGTPEPIKLATSRYTERFVTSRRSANICAVSNRPPRRYLRI